MRKALKGILTLIVILSLVLFACTSDPVEVEDPVEGPDEGNETVEVDKLAVRVAALKGPTGMGMVKLMEDKELGTTELDYDFTLMGSPDELTGKIINGEVDVAAVPTNLASVIYNKTEGDIQLAAVNTLGVLYLMENGQDINDISDLKGKTVNISGKGATPDFAFQYILEKNGLKADEDVTLDFTLQHADLAAAVSAGDIDIALLPQPHVTTALMKNEDVRIALDITEEWSKVMEDEGQLVMGVIIVQRDFAENNKEALNTFLDEYKQSVEFVNEEIDEAAELIAKYEILPNTEIAKNAIPYCNIVYNDAQEAKSFIEEFYQVLYNFEPKSIGGQLTDDEFYYKK